MTVQQMIELLINISDKDKKVVYRNDYLDFTYKGIRDIIHELSEEDGNCIIIYGK